MKIVDGFSVGKNWHVFFFYSLCLPIDLVPLIFFFFFFINTIVPPQGAFNSWLAIRSSFYCILFLSIGIFTALFCPFIIVSALFSSAYITNQLNVYSILPFRYAVNSRLAAYPSFYCLFFSLTLYILRCVHSSNFTFYFPLAKLHTDETSNQCYYLGEELT